MLNKYIYDDIVTNYKSFFSLLISCLCLVAPCPIIFFHNPFIFHTYVYAFISFILSIYILANKKNISISSITFYSIIILLFFILRNLFTLGPHHIRWISCIFFLIIFSSHKISKKVFTEVLKITCIVELTICFWQIYTNQNTFFYATGTFDNPSGLSILFTLSFPFLFYDLKKTKGLFDIILIALIVIVLFLTEERKAIIVLSFIILINTRQKSSHIHKRILGTLALILLGMILIKGILSPASSVGRIFILLGSLNICYNNLLFGGGIYAFGKEYMLWQADFFSKNLTSQYALLADNVVHSQNELLNLMIENGLFFIAILTPLIYIFINSLKHHRTIWHDCIIAISMLSMLTYCFHYFITIFIVILCLTQIKTRTIFYIKFPTMKKLIFLTAFLLLPVIKGAMFEYKWKQTAKKYSESYDINIEINESFKKLEKWWNGNPNFYYNYASISRNSLNYQESNTAIIKYNKYYVDYDSYVMLANNYYDLKDYTKAEQYYISAHKMCPNRFVPLQGVLRTAIKRGNKEKAKKIAREILHKPEKIKSYKTKIIKYEAKKIIENI